MPSIDEPEPWSMPGIPNAKYTATPSANAMNAKTITLPDRWAGPSSWLPRALLTGLLP